ncbi:E3 ubiquitin-protein ligase mind-bomb [Exaiptasia diaphana]|nr:E3 ubiquitin-protein ligase mind-bomb [Exaiptasia diaphana]
MIPKYKAGDKVLVSSDKKFVMEMQEGHGGWNDKMKTILGMIGTIKAVHEEDGDVVMSVEGNIWLVNPAILTLHEAAKGDSDDEDMSNPIESLLKQQVQLQKR